MGAVAHYIEGEGIATAGISLVREHTLKIRPPRALWVPFEFGQPMGPPNQPEFQMDVLRSLLALFTHTDGPVLVDYPKQPSVSGDADMPWACPIPLQRPEPATEAERLRRDLIDEVERLRPWHEEALRSRHRTTVGNSGLDAGTADQMAEVLAAFAFGEPVEAPPGATEPMPVLLRYLADDLKAFYFEAVTAQPGSSSPGSTELNRWLYYETVLGHVLYRLWERVASAEDQALRRLSRVIIPVAYRPQMP